VTEHIIEYVARDRTGITTVVTATGVVDVDTVIRDIRFGHSGYFVAPGEWRRTPVRSLSVLGSAYLFANWDGSKRNNLHDLAFQAPARTALPARPPVLARILAPIAALFGRTQPRD
jgi:hypothetical protein